MELAAKAYFGYYSTKLTKSEKRKLRELVAKVPKGAVVTTTVTGVVRAKGAKNADRARALKRARTVAAYLKRQGLAGTIIATNKGRTEASTKTARRVEIAITYTK